MMMILMMMMMTMTTKMMKTEKTKGKSVTMGIDSGTRIIGRFELVAVYMTYSMMGDGTRGNG